MTDLCLAVPGTTPDQWWSQAPQDLATILDALHRRRGS